MAEEALPKPEDLSKVGFEPPATGWMDTKLDIPSKRGSWCYSAGAKHGEYLGEPNAHEWAPQEEDWHLPENWQQIILDGMQERLQKYRSFRLFMDICVRCGACADKCHFYLGTGDPKNMPVLRAELLRSVYKRYFTKAGRLFGKMAGARDLTIDVLKEWYYYFYQCTECRRCSVFCPYGIDTADVTMIGRELLNLVGINIGWVMEPVANCYRTGNHLGVRPNTFKDNLDFAAEDLEDITGVHVDVPIDKKGAEVLVVVPSADYFANPHYFTFLGYLALFNEIGLDYTFSPFATEGGNFGLFLSHDMMKRLNAKIYYEAKRLGVKWILGAECGHMWRVLHQYMDTMNGPADFLEVPKSPFTGTVFENAKTTKTVHITEFTADLIRHDKLNLDKSRNDHLRVTFHDSCNPARAMGLLEEPRYIMKKVLNNFIEMPENTIREQTYCCGGGSGLGSDENMEARLRGGLPRANAVKYVRDEYGVNTLACICAIDKAVLPPLVDYWIGDVEVAGIHEFVGNALMMKGQNERLMDLRNEPIPHLKKKEAEEEVKSDA
jgi:[DsrC]-trisulfide reductase subunit K